MRFLLDEDVHPGVAAIGRSAGIDVVSVHEEDRCGLSGREQLAYAAQEDRILVTRNRDDFIRLTVEFFQTAAPHRGVLIIPFSIPNSAPKKIVDALERWIAACPVAFEAALFIDFLSKEQIR